jgi:hypothetical protein
VKTGSCEVMRACKGSRPVFGGPFLGKSFPCHPKLQFTVQVIGCADAGSASYDLEWKAKEGICFLRQHILYAEQRFWERKGFMPFRFQNVVAGCFAVSRTAASRFSAKLHYT